ncbi:MAG TPA: dTDP-4-dehydrorhamnose 3,5-epimerase [Ohtaekwangia sp.]
MEVRETGIAGLVEIIPAVFEDDRGWFYEFYNEKTFSLHGIEYKFVQENQSFSKKGVVRGLHAQRAPFAQAKLVTVLVGKVLDVVVDMRAGSPTFGKVYTCVLDASQHNMLMIPEGFAHGFSALTDSIFFYKCSQVYNREAEIGIRWNDPDLRIDWQVDDPVISDKDQILPTLDELLIKSVISRY